MENNVVENLPKGLEEYFADGRCLINESSGYNIYLDMFLAREEAPRAKTYWY